MCVVGQTSHCSVMEAFLDECEPEEVDRNRPMTLGNATKVCDGYVRRWGTYQSNDILQSFRRLIGLNYL